MRARGARVYGLGARTKEEKIGSASRHRRRRPIKFSRPTREKLGVKAGFPPRRAPGPLVAPCGPAASNSRAVKCIRQRDDPTLLSTPSGPLGADLALGTISWREIASNGRGDRISRAPSVPVPSDEPSRSVFGPSASWVTLFSLSLGRMVTDGGRISARRRTDVATVTSRYRPLPTVLPPGPSSNIIPNGPKSAAGAALAARCWCQCASDGPGSRPAARHSGE